MGGLKHCLCVTRGRDKKIEWFSLQGWLVWRDPSVESLAPAGAWYPPVAADRPPSPNHPTTQPPNRATH